MSNALYRLGRLAARRPWRVIGAWLVLAMVVIGASSAFGQELTDSMEVPGLDSQVAIDLLTEAESDAAGLTAQVVMTPSAEGATFFESAEAQTALAEVQAAVQQLPNVLGTTDAVGSLAAGPQAAAMSGSVSADGRVALIRVQYPLVEDLSAADLDNLKDAGGAFAGSPIRVELSGDLFYQFESAETGIGEMIGIVVEMAARRA